MYKINYVVKFTLSPIHVNSFFCIFVTIFLILPNLQQSQKISLYQVQDLKKKQSLRTAQGPRPEGPDIEAPKAEGGNKVLRKWEGGGQTRSLKPRPQNILGVEEPKSASSGGKFPLVSLHKHAFGSAQIRSELHIVYRPAAE